jgi:hypothetical protein
MPKYEVKYVCYISYEVDASTEDEAGDRADFLLNQMTGADFREECEWEGTKEYESS